MFLEAAVEADLAALVALERPCFTHPWSVSSFRDELRDPARGRVVVLREPAAGPERGASSSPTALFQVVPTSCTSTTWRCARSDAARGWAGSLLRRVLELGARRGARVALLEVRRATGRRSRCTARSASRSRARARGYYAEPREDALLLRREGLDTLLDERSAIILEIRPGACYVCS